MHRLARLSIAAMLALAIVAPVWANDIGNSSWSENANSNTAAAPNGWPSGLAPNQVSPVSRETMAAVKRWYDHIQPTVTSIGTSNSQTLVYAVSPSDYAAGDVYWFKAGYTNTSSMVLNVNPLSNIQVQWGGVALVGGEVRQGYYYGAVYDGSHFQIIGGLPAVRGQTPGTMTNDDACTGCIGEYVKSNIPSGSAVTLLSSGTAYDVTFIPLAAGDWTVCGSVSVGFAGASNTNWAGWFNLSSASLPTPSDTITAGTGPFSAFNVAAISASQTFAVGCGRVSTDISVNVYLSVRSIYTGGSPTAYGYIFARRAR